MARYNTRSSARKVASIKFVGDEDVLNHIITINNVKHNQDSNVNKTPNKSDYFFDDSSDDEVTTTEEQRQVPQALYDEDEKAGNELFTFKSSKNKDGIMQKALRSVDKLKLSTSKRGKKKSSQHTPKLKEKVATPKDTKKVKTSTETEIPQKTPYNLRRKIKQKIAKMASEEQHLNSEESEDTDSEDSEQNDAEDSICERLNFSHLNSDDDSDDNNKMTEKYFRAQIGKAVTSNHTLSRLDNPRLDHHAMQNALKSVTASHPTESDVLKKGYRKLYPKWMFQLREGFNLLFYGLGSKRQLLLKIREKMLSGENCLVVNGFFTNITIKNILTSIIEDVFDSKSTQNPQEMLSVIKNLINSSGCDFYLIIHNIDGPMLRSEKAQDILSKLAQIDKIRLLASIDHINTPLIWDQSKLTHFNWIWHDVTNFIPYTDETAFENTLLVQPTNNLVLSSLTHVFRSLNPKAKGIFLMLANYQLDNKVTPAYIGMSYQDCYRKCRESFLVISDLTFKAQLTEFKDHKLIKFKKGPDAVEHLLIPLEANLLSEFVEQNKL